MRSVIHRIGGLETDKIAFKCLYVVIHRIGGLENDGEVVRIAGNSYTPHRWLRKNILNFWTGRAGYTPHRWLRKMTNNTVFAFNIVIHRIGGLEKCLGY